MLVWEDADDTVRHLKSPLSLERVGTVQLEAMLPREAQIRQDARLSGTHDGRELWHLGADLIDSGAPLGAGGLDRLPHEGGGEKSRDDTPSAVAGMGTLEDRRPPSLAVTRLSR